ncbi:MAG: phosphate ABC transporter permease PstA [Paenibacillaceae bacterium]
MDQKLEISIMMRRRRKNKLFHFLFLLATLFGVVALALLLAQVLVQGLSWVNWDFIFNYSSRIAKNAGIKAAIVGTFYIMIITAPLSLIIGVSTAIYLEEYAKDTWISRLIQTNISNLAGIPSIVYGLLGLTVFVRILGFERSILSGALTMTLLVLPIVIVASQEAIKAIPNSQRMASYALGANRWQTVIRITLPSALPGILTGAILSMSRAIGETAPLIVIGAVQYIAFLPSSIFDSFTVLPIQIYSWSALPSKEFSNVAAAGIIVLLIMLLSMNAIAIFLRNKFQKKA